MSEADSTQVPRWASRPTRDLITIALLVATGAACGVLMARGTRDWRCQATLGRAGPGTVVDVTDDGGLVGVAWSNHLVNVYDAETGEAVRGLKTDAGRPSAVAVSTDGSRMAIGFPDAPVTVWTFEPRWDEDVLDEATRGAESLAFSSDGRVLACWQGEVLSAWRLPSGQRLAAAPLRFHDAEGARLRFSDHEKGILAFPVATWISTTHGLFLDTDEPVDWYGEVSSDVGDTVVFPTEAGAYATRRYDLEAEASSGTKDTFTGVVMRPGASRGSPTHTNLFVVDFAHAVAKHANALAFDNGATRAAYVSTAGRVHVMRQAQPGDWMRGAAPWVALGLGGAFLLWLVVAWRSGTRHVQAEKQAVAEAAERLGEGKQRMPVDLFILIYLIALSGVAGIVSMIVTFAFGGGFIDVLAFLNLFAAARLLKFHRGWRWFVLFEIWFGFFTIGIFVGSLLPEGVTPLLRPVWGGVWNVSRGIMWGQLAVFAAALGWACLTLTRFRTRILFAKAAAHLPDMVPLTKAQL